MATRSAIGMIVDGKVRGVYCHWDGYPAGVGATLDQHYTDPAKIMELIEHGQISSLGSIIGTQHPFSSHGFHSVEEYDRLYGEMTTFYGRDRGELDVGYKEFATLDAFVDFYTGSCCEYFYFYDHPKGWTVRESCSTTDWQSIKDYSEEEEVE